MKVPRDLTSYIRVLKMASTPSSEEFFQVAKIAGLGILVVGAIGFMIYLLMGFLPGDPGVGL